MRILRKSIWRLYAGCSLVQQSYVMHMQLMSYVLCAIVLCVQSFSSIPGYIHNL